MTISDKEALASLRVLVCMAQADGVLHESEKKALAVALDGIDLPDDVTVDSLANKSFDLKKQLSRITNPQARSETYKSAYLLAHADGDYAEEEKAVVAMIASELEIDAAQQERVGALVSVEDGSDEPQVQPAFSFIEDPDERAATVERETLKCSVISALFGAFPVPGLAIATDLAVVAFQVNLVRDIGSMWGKEVDKKSAKGLLAALGVGTGLRLAVNNVLKLFPGWGSLAGATTSFASTFAVGRVINRHFENPDNNVEDLQEEFQKAEKDGKKAYKENKAAIEEKKSATMDALEVLNARLENGEITQAEFEKQATAIG